MNFSGPFPSYQPMVNQNNKVSLAPALFVGNLDEFIQDEHLFEYFSQFGPIHFVRVMRDSSTGKSRGYGFVNFVQPRDAEIAKIHAHHQQLGSKLIRVMFKRNMRDLPSESNLYIKNLDPEVSVIDLEKHFSQIGPILSSKVSTNFEGKSLEYGYVQFENVEDSKKALETLQGSKLGNREIVIEEYVPKDKRTNQIAKRNLYVKNLPNNMEEAELNKLVEEFFSKFGEIEMKLVKKHASENKWSAFICYKKESDAEKCFASLSEKPETLKGAEEPLYLNWHQSKSVRAAELKQNYTGSHSESNLYLKNLRTDLTDTELKAAFQQFGNVTSVCLKDWKATVGSKAAKFGFVAYSTIQEAKKAHELAFQSPEVKALYIAYERPYINLHQSKDRRHEYLQSERRKYLEMQAYYYWQTMAMMNPRHAFPPPMNFRPRQQPGPVRYSNYHANPQSRGGNNQNYNQRQQQHHDGGYNKKGNWKDKNQHQHENKGGKKHDNHSQIAENAATQAITVNNLRKKLPEFLGLAVDKQRQILGELLFPLVLKHSTPQYAPKITGMLIDLDVLEVSEILEFFENDALLKERVEEALELVTQSA